MSAGEQRPRREWIFTFPIGFYKGNAEEARKQEMERTLTKRIT